MPIPNPPLPKAPAPTKIFFDPFNSSSSGHQTAPSNLAGTTSWRNSRICKLTSQFQDSSGRGGSQHLSDLVGAGSKDFRKDGRKDNGDWEKGAPGLREAGWQDIRGLMSGPRKRSLQETERSTAKKPKNEAEASTEDTQHPQLQATDAKSQKQEVFPDVTSVSAIDTDLTSPSQQLPQIFRGLTVYLNGSTAPLISDHKLKNLFVTHGGNVYLGLARRSVTHVILGDTGLAAGKIQKEVRTVRGESVKYVTAQWVVDSVKAGKRKREGPYLPKELGTGGTGQKSVAQMFSKSKER